MTVKNKSDFSKRMDELSRKLSKVTEEVADESFKPTRTLNRDGARLPKRKYDKRNSQHGFGVSERVTLALKLDLDPWTLKRWKGKW